MSTEKQKLLAKLSEIKKSERQSNYDSAKRRLAKIYSEVDEQTTIYATLDNEVEMLIRDGDWKEMIGDLEKEVTKSYKKLVRLKAKREKSKNGLRYFQELAQKSS